jgi:hypothetical protein
MFGVHWLNTCIGCTDTVADRSKHDPLKLNYMHNAAVVTLSARLALKQILVKTEAYIQFCNDITVDLE